MAALGLITLPGAKSLHLENLRSLNFGLPHRSVSLQCPWRTLVISRLWTGFKCPSSRFSKQSVNIQTARKHGDLAIAFAASPGQADPVISIQLYDEVNFSTETFGDKKLKVTVNVTEKGTQKALDIVLDSLSKSTPPVKGFRKGKGGKSIVPRNVLYQMLVPSRVNKFVIEETVTSTILEYVEKEDIKVKKDFKTVQSTEELAAAFQPGEKFGFDAILELEEATETV